MRKTKEVYCIDCRRYYSGDCWAPEGFTGKTIKNYITGNIKERLWLSRNDKNYPNRDGKCPYYKRKWWKFWRAK